QEVVRLRPLRVPPPPPPTTRRPPADSPPACSPSPPSPPSSPSPSPSTALTSPPPRHGERPPPLAPSTNCSRVRFAINAEDSLNNRFRPIQGLTTDAVFSVDDDLIVPCSTLRFAFAVWQSALSAMVGFVPRMHWLTDPCFSIWIP
ncbi:Os04g0219000, partial [Oryza sativa Japonica Group]